MTYLVSLTLFIWLGAVTPGPVNIVTLSTSVNHGWIKALPFVVGASVAYAIVVLTTGTGLSQIVFAVPGAEKFIMVVGGGYLLYIAYVLARTRHELLTVEESPSPPSFIQGALMQWLNPKAWVFASSGISLFVTRQSDMYMALAVFTVLALFVCFIGVGTWIFIGHLLQTALKNNRYQMWLNRSMAALLCVVIIPMMFTS